VLSTYAGPGTAEGETSCSTLTSGFISISDLISISSATTFSTSTFGASTVEARNVIGSSSAGAGGVDGIGCANGAGAMIPGFLTIPLTLSISVAPLLFSLATWLLSLFSLLLPPDAEPPEMASALNLGGAFQRGISHSTPVKLLTLKLPFAHFRQGFPDLSRARKPALIAPWFALGPSLCVAVPVPVALGVVFEWSMVPSSLMEH